MLRCVRLLHPQSSPSSCAIASRIRLPLEPSRARLGCNVVKGGGASAASLLASTQRTPLTPARGFATTWPCRMASETDYMAFLDKANQDAGDGLASVSNPKHEFKATEEGAQVPAVLAAATKDAYYSSDADEPFVPVCLSWDEAGKGLPDEEEFAGLIGHPKPSEASISLQGVAEWDSQAQYGDVIEAVTKAGRGNPVKVYKVVRDHTRVEYWLVTTEGKGKSAKLVGVKALAVES